MIDIHTHILFGVDDGCKTIEESIQSIKKAVEIGVTDIIFTPHHSVRRTYSSDVPLIQENFLKLKEEIHNKKIDIQVHLGQEIDEEDGMIDRIENGSALTINNTKFVLIDFAMREVDIDDILYELIIKGYKPIVAHPERYQYVKNMDKIRKWKETGALIQVNSNGLFSNAEIKKKFNYIIKNKLADFIATDSHGDTEAYIKHQKAYNHVKKKTDIEYANKIFTDNAIKLQLT